MSIGSAGNLMGTPTKALEDIGSDLNIISKDFAEQNVLAYNNGFASGRNVEFANGTKKSTEGVIRNMT